MLDIAKRSSEQIEFLKDIIDRTKRNNSRIVQETSSRLDAARAEALRLAGELTVLDGVRRVIHFGSSATGRNFRLDSDIDLAISGGDILEAMRISESSRFHVDVIDIDAVPSPLKEAILQQGVVLYEER